MKRLLEAFLVSLKMVCHYSGIEFIWRKFFPTNGELPTGWIWLISLYFACFAFTSQRYESRCDHIENKYEIFISQILSGVPFDVDKLTVILDSKIPCQPNLWDIASIAKSFAYPQYGFGHFFETFEHDNGESCKDMPSALSFHINQWKHRLSMSKLNELSLNGIDLEEGNLTMSTIMNVDLSTANMNKVNLSKATIHLSKLERSKLFKALISQATLNGVACQNASFRKAILCDAKIYNTNCNYTCFDSAVIDDTKISESEFNNSKFFNSSLNKCEIQSSNFTNSFFVNANMRNTRWDNVNINKTSFWGSDLSESEFTNSNMNMVDFRNANLNGVIFRDTSLKDADMRGADLKNVTVDLELLVDVKSLSGAINIPEEIIFGVKRLKRGHLFDPLPENEKVRTSL